MKKIILMFGLLAVLLAGCASNPTATDVANRLVNIQSVSRAGNDWQDGICEYNTDKGSYILNGCIGDDFTKAASNLNNTGFAKGTISGGCLGLNEHGIFEIHTMRIEGSYIHSSTGDIQKLCYVFRYLN